MSIERPITPWRETSNKGILAILIAVAPLEKQRDASTNRSHIILKIFSGSKINADLSFSKKGVIGDCVFDQTGRPEI